MIRLALVAIAALMLVGCEIEEEEPRPSSRSNSSGVSPSSQNRCTAAHREYLGVVGDEVSNAADALSAANRALDRGNYTRMFDELDNFDLHVITAAGQTVPPRLRAPR